MEKEKIVDSFHAASVHIAHKEKCTRDSEIIVEARFEFASGSNLHLGLIRELPIEV